MKILIFGVGGTYRIHKENISITDEIIGFLDNNPDLWGTLMDGVTIHCPADILQISYDKVILMSIHALEIRNQLLELGCKASNIMHYMEYISSQNEGKMQMEFPLEKVHGKKKRCLVISTDLGYNGGSLSAFYLAMALQNKGYETVIAAPDGNPFVIEEIKRKGICILLYQNLPYASEEELFWVEYFQHVIVNTLQMSCCAGEIARTRKVILWLHEPLELYGRMEYWKEKIEEGIHREHLSIYAVSSIAKKNFVENYHFPIVELFPYGIPDTVDEVYRYTGNGLMFAVIGAMIPLKGQDLFLDAIERLDVEERNRSFFLMAGKVLDDEYGIRIKKRVEQYPSIQITGECTRENIKRIYQRVDVFVIASREETMSMVATEAMMLGKPCIISDVSGMAAYVKDYRNGFKFEADNVKELVKRMRWCMNNTEMLKKIGEEARATYESNFSMEVFGDNLERVLLR